MVQMHVSAVAAAVVALLATTVIGAAKEKPACVAKCWNNSQYVSPHCADEMKCLCDDTEFQNTVYQCLYSQCQTAQFGSALHHTLALCHDPELQAQAQAKKKEVVKPTVPALIRQPAPNVEKRQYKATQSVSVSVTRSVTMSRPMQSVTRSVTQSRSRPTQSVSASNYMSYATSRALSSVPPMVTQIADGQIQAPYAMPTLAAVTQIADGQIQGPVVTQVGDGQPQAPTSTSPAKRWWDRYIMG